MAPHALLLSDVLLLLPLLLQLLVQRVGGSGEVWSGGAYLQLQVDPADSHRLVSQAASPRGGRGNATTPFYPVGFYPAIDAVTHQQPAELDSFYRALNDQQSASGINYMRQLFTIGQPAGPTPLPYERASRGDGRVNLTRFNTTLFGVWDRLLSHAAARGVVVQICILDAWHNKQLVTDPDPVEGPFGLKYGEPHRPCPA
jgi:hypothetical protein